MKPIKVGIYTLGCRVNMYESCAIAEKLEDLGYTVSKTGNCQYYIVNTCAVTAESERKSRQLVRRCASKGKVLVIGCAAQIENNFLENENVVFVSGNHNKMSVVDYLENDSKEIIDNISTMDNVEYEEMSLCGRDLLFSECRAFIKIQDGCNGKCTYCIIPKCRGKVRSRSQENIIEEAKRLVGNGYSEIILTGIEVSAYNKCRLSELIRKVSEIRGVKRIRLGSLSPNIINDLFLEEVSSVGSFMPHLHLSLQSCCDKILSAMKRPYRKRDIIDRVKAIRKYMPNCIITSDIIVGFPGETEENFRETVETLKELKIFHVHSFPYSERNGTPAAEMTESVPKQIRSSRNVTLIEECSKIKNSILDEHINKSLSVLIEKIKDGKAFGHTEEFIEACIDANHHKTGEIVEFVAKSHDGNMIYG